jgi:beta-glucosidase
MGFERYNQVMTEGNSSEKFPKDFLWGTAISSHQVEGGNKNDWTQGEKKFGLPISGKAVDFYHYYEGDFSLAKDFLHNNSIRLSVEWSRLQPESSKGFIQKETDHYIKVLETAKNRGLSPMVTLHHFTDPIWFSEKGSWTNKDNLPFFTDYVMECKKKFGDLADFWITINEPWVLGSMGYLAKMWPPMKMNPILFAKAYLNMAKAHNEAYKILTETKKPTGSANQMTDIRNLPPFDRLLGTLLNHSFLDLTRNSNDFIGLNYYKPWYLIPNKESKSFPRSDFNWLIDAKGLYNVTLGTWNRYKLPIFITENGIADASDTKRSSYITEHLKAIKQLINEGVDIKGYYHWSLLDNYEWQEGYKMKFGLFSVNPETMQAIPRKSAEVYAKICRENKINP